MWASLWILCLTLVTTLSAPNENNKFVFIVGGSLPVQHEVLRNLLELKPHKNVQHDSSFEIFTDSNTGESYVNVDLSKTLSLNDIVKIRKRVELFKTVLVIYTPENAYEMSKNYTNFMKQLSHNLNEESVGVLTIINKETINGTEDDIIQILQHIRHQDMKDESGNQVRFNSKHIQTRIDSNNLRNLLQNLTYTEVLNHNLSTVVEHVVNKTMESITNQGKSHKGITNFAHELEYFHSMLKNVEIEVPRGQLEDIMLRLIEKVMNSRSPGKMNQITLMSALDEFDNSSENFKHQVLQDATVHILGLKQFVSRLYRWYQIFIDVYVTAGFYEVQKSKYENFDMDFFDSSYNVTSSTMDIFLYKILASNLTKDIRLIDEPNKAQDFVVRDANEIVNLIRVSFTCSFGLFRVIGNFITVSVDVVKLLPQCLDEKIITIEIVSREILYFDSDLEGHFTVSILAPILEVIGNVKIALLTNQKVEHHGKRGKIASNENLVMEIENWINGEDLVISRHHPHSDTTKTIDTPSELGVRGNSSEEMDPVETSSNNIVLIVIICSIVFVVIATNVCVIAYFYRERRCYSPVAVRSGSSPNIPNITDDEDQHYTVVCDSGN